MAAPWVLVPCLVQLRAEINEVAPARDRASDGTIGDLAHQQSVSDHNDDEVGRVPVKDADADHEVHAVDVDDDLRRPGITMQDIVDVVVGRHRSGADDRLTYVIYDRKIWSASRDWLPRAYDGPSPHLEHAHFSASYVTTKERDMRSFKIKEGLGIGLVAITAADAKIVWQTSDSIIGQTPAGALKTTMDRGNVVYGRTEAAALAARAREGVDLAAGVPGGLAARLDALEAHLVYIRQTLDAHANPE